MSADASRSQELLQQLGINVLRHVKTETSSVTTAWGVTWDEEYIARDVLQNFFDANRNHLDAVQVTAKHNTVTVTGPAPCSLEHLFYLGSEKDSDRNVGQYGEGFKAAAVCLLRDQGVPPVALSGSEALSIRLAQAPVPGTQMHPLCYDFFETKHRPGTTLILSGCRPKLVAALEDGLSHFFYDSNRLVGPKRWPTKDGEFAIYDSTTSGGHLFYRSVRRAEIPNIPLVLVIDKKDGRIEKVIGNDRDRNAFGEKLRKSCYNVIARSGIRWNIDAQRIVVEAARAAWAEGHPLLSQISDARGYRNPWGEKIAAEVFGDRHFARSRTNNSIEQLRIDEVEKQWRDEGRQGLPAYFEAFGVLTAERFLEGQTKRASEAERREPSQAERACIELLREVLHDFAPELHGVFAKGRTAYSVARTEAALGALRTGRDNSREVFLAELIFVGDFATACATFLHEHAHVFGHDGGRGFTDALTEVLEAVVRNRRALDKHEQRWTDLSIRVQAEREGVARQSVGTDPLEARLDAMSQVELRNLLRRVPPVVLRSLTRNK